MDGISSGSCLTANFNTSDELSVSNDSQLVASIVRIEVAGPPKFYPPAKGHVTVIQKTKIWSFHYREGLK